MTPRILYHHVFMARIAQMCDDIQGVIHHDGTDHDDRMRLAGAMAVKLDALIWTAYRHEDSEMSRDQRHSMNIHAIAVIQSTVSALAGTLPRETTWADVQTAITEDTTALISYTGIQL